MESRLMRKVLTAALLVVVAAVLVAGFAVVFREAPTPYATVQAHRGDIEVLIAASGKVRAKESVDVGAQVSGQLEAIHVGIGSRVQQGDLLAEIDPILAQAQVDQARAELKELRASLMQQEASLDLARLTSRRAEMLQSEDAISQADFEIAVAEERIAQGRLAQLTAQIERQESTLKANLANLDYTKIYAPISGTVVTQLAVVGQTLNANQTTPTVLTIADLTVMTVEAEISEADVLRIEAGQSATFKLLGSGREWQTEVRQVLPQPEVLNDVVLYKALLDVDNSDGALRPEMTAQVFFSQGRADDTVLVPVGALQQEPQLRGEAVSGAREGGAPQNDRQGGSLDGLSEALGRYPDAERAVVLVAQGNTAEPRPVLLGLRNRSHAQVLYGLNEGEQVVVGRRDDSEPDSGPSPRPFGFRR